MKNIKHWIVKNPDLAFAVLLAICVYSYFALTNEFFATHRTGYAIMERFAVLGLVGLALTLCIIAGEIDLSIGSNAALAAVIVVRFTDSLGAVTALVIAILISTLVGAIQGYFIAYLRVRAIVLTVGTLMLLRGVALFAAQEKTVMLTDFRVPDFISTKMFVYFSPASLLVIAMFIVVGLFMTFTRYGREIYAIGGARKEAVAAGIDLKRPMIIVFAISAFATPDLGRISVVSYGPSGASRCRLRGYVMRRKFDFDDGMADPQIPGYSQSAGYHIQLPNWINPIWIFMAGA